MLDKRVYTVSTSHLDTVWRWNLATTIEEYILNTLAQNFELLEKYPEYKFNFEGAFRYELIEEYYPDLFEKLSAYAKDGRWLCAGSEYENGDVNIPSPEALFRNILIGNNYFEKKLARRCKDIFLPDCFGFGWALPSVISHANLKGFSTQKLSWGSANGIPFDIGYWQGVDKSKVFASFDARSYRYCFEDPRTDIPVIDKIAQNATNAELPWTMQLHGTGDWGGAPKEKSVEAVCNAVKENESNDFSVISASSDEIFKDLDNLKNEAKMKLPVYNGELLMTSHGAGSYTSRTISKRLNRKCEDMADTAEKACVFADSLGVYKYPSERLLSDWKRVIRHQFHDDITGTSVMEVYNEAVNDYYISLMGFKDEYEGAVGAIANELCTDWVEECAVVVNNPCAFKRCEAVYAKVKINHNAPYVKVFDSNNTEIASQVISKNGKEFEIAFLCDIDSLGYKVYDVRPSTEKCTIETDTHATLHSLENENYLVRFNKNGDIASVFDKKLLRELLSAPIKLALLHDTGALSYPSWEIRKEDIDAEPYCFANTPIFELKENGPARVSIKITRQAEYSTVEQTVSLDSKSNYVRVDNNVNWQTRRTMMKAVFPFTVKNDFAAYDLGLGVIKRKTNTDRLYEVPAQRFADISDELEKRGVCIFSDSRVGWDKPEINTLRLTCIHTPAGAFTKETRQDLQDLGRNIFSFGIYSHSGNEENGCARESEAFAKRLVAFQTSARKKGSLGNSYSFADISNESIALRAFKKSENGNSYVIRVNNTSDNEIKNASFNIKAEIQNAKEIFASEEYKGECEFDKHSIKFNLGPYEVKSFEFELANAVKKKGENFKKLDLPFNIEATTKNSTRKQFIMQASGCSLASELFLNSLVYKGITFKFGDTEEKNALVPRGQIIDIPKGMTKLYILASSISTDREAVFYADSKEKKITVHSMFESVAQWDMAGLAQSARVKSVSPALVFTHVHHPQDDKYNCKANFFMYEIDVRNASKLTLPEDNRIVILAMTAVKKFSNTKIACELYDFPDGDCKFDEIPPIDKIIDKASFATIRAGKIQDQKNGGKGKGFKRDNIITNIIRSYTKSEW